MTVNVGVIGAGMIGQDHIRRLTYVLSGARVTAVTDVDLDRAKSAVERLPGVQVHETGQDLISDPGVDAIIVASWGPTHEEYVLAGIAAGKQVFCEKPLATTREACERILDAEVAAGRRLVMVGFMRRYDDGYRAMKEALDRGDIGAPLVFHSAHRNPSVPPSVTTDGVIVDTCVHDIDVARFLLGSEVVAAQVFNPRRSSLAAEQLQDPLILLLEMANGALVDVEAAVNVVYGYDIRGEILGETGTVELAESSRIIVKRKGEYSGRVPTDWRERFVRAYDTEFQEWINAVAAGTSTGPSSWDGYAATVVTDAGSEACAYRAAGDRFDARAARPVSGSDRLRHRNRLRVRRIHHGQDRSRSCDVPRGHVGRRRSTKGRRTGLRIPGALAPGGLLLLAPLSEGGRRRIVRCEKGVPGNRGENSDTGSGFQLGIR